MILGDIIYAITEECKYFLLGQGGTAILDTDLKQPYTDLMPLVVVEVENAGDSAQLPGGWTRFDLDIAFNVYNYQPGAYDNSVISASLLDIIDQIRQFFEKGIWQTNFMINLTTNYGFKILYMGQNKAPQIEGSEGIISGWKLNFSSVALDMGTSSYQNELEETQNITGETIINGEIVT